MSKVGKHGQLEDLQRKNLLLEAEVSQLKEELEQVKTQLSQHRQVNDSQKVALKDKDSLLEQLREVNQSLQNDVKVLKEVKPARVVSGPVNPWSDSSNPDLPQREQYRKLFVGGLNFSSNESGLEEYFQQYGDVEKVQVLMDEQKRSRGFGFVVFKAASMADAAMEARPHTVDGRRVDLKRALPKEDTVDSPGQVKKMFVGGFRSDTEEHHLDEYFSQFGRVSRVEMMVYKDTGKKRGFAFVYFDDYDTVDKIVLIKHHVINGSPCTVKKAVPVENMKKNRNQGPSGYWSAPNDNKDMGGMNQGQFGGKQGGFGANQGRFSGNQGGFGGNQGGFGGNQGGFGGNQGNMGNTGGNQGGLGGNQGNFGGNQGGFGGNMGGNQSGFGGNQGNMGGNQGGYGGPSNQDNFRGSQGGGNQGNFGGNQGGFDNQGNMAGNQGMSESGGKSADIPPQMAAMWSAFKDQFMSTMAGGGDKQSGGGPVRNTSSHQHRSEPYNNAGSSGFNQNSEGFGQNRDNAPYNSSSDTNMRD